MFGAIAGDIIGSVFERAGLKTTSFQLFNKKSTFTDDTVLTFAIAKALLKDVSYRESVQGLARKYPGRGYGGNFRQWINETNPPPYNSYGNGSAMRVSPVGFAFNELDSVLEEAKRSAVITHDHPEGIKGARAVAASVWLARNGASKEVIREWLSSEVGYDMDRSVEEIRPHYSFDVSCQGSVPEALICFLDSSDLESAIRLAVSLGGDSDTQACIAGAVAQAYYQEVPGNIYDQVIERLPREFVSILKNFEKTYQIHYTII